MWCVLQTLNMSRGGFDDIKISMKAYKYGISMVLISLNTHCAFTYTQFFGFAVTLALYFLKFLFSLNKQTFARH